MNIVPYVRIHTYNEGICISGPKYRDFADSELLSPVSRGKLSHFIHPGLSRLFIIFACLVQTDIKAARNFLANIQPNI